MGSASEIIELDWLTYGNAEHLALCLHQQPDFIWLDSANESHPDNQYHILSWAAQIRLEACKGKVTSSSPELPLPARYIHRPFAALDYFEQELSWPVQQLCDLPFQGGWLGYWSYDLGRYLEKMPQQAEADLALPDMLVGWYDAALIIDTKHQTVSLVGRKEQIQAMAKTLAALCKPELEHFQLTSTWRSNMSSESYANKFEQVQEYLRSGDCYQVNLAQRHTAHYQGSPFHAYLTLRKENCCPFSAYMNTAHGQILSLSPERFIRSEQGKIQTKPIKGTRPRLANHEADQKQQKALKTAPKDRAENLMIVDLLRNDIGRVSAPGTVSVPALFEVESFAAVHHLVSTITGELASDKSVYDLLAASFPGGSITGAPKLRAMEIIEELEPHRRSVYCGSIGYLSMHGQMDTNIAIRTLVCDNQGTIYCWAGGGLVADSECAAEYQETHDKLKKITPVLQAL